jgi:Tubulin binding cofactor C.
MITNLLKKHFRKFIVELGNSYIQEENSEFLKREEKITKLNINTGNEVLIFREVHEPLTVSDISCGTLNIQEALKNIDFELLYDAIHNGHIYKGNSVYDHKLLRGFDISCENVHQDINIRNITNSVILVSNSHKNINISNCTNCIIVVVNVHGKVNIRNCVSDIFLTETGHFSSPKYSNMLGCKRISIHSRGGDYDLYDISEVRA